MDSILMGWPKYLTTGIGIITVLLLIYCLSLRNDRDKALNKLSIANQTITGLNAYIDKTRAQLKIIQQLDNDYQEQLRNAQVDNDKLRDSLANGAKRVYVKADCTLSDTTATRSINATTSRLAEDARQDYLRLRVEIEQTKQQILGLQHYIKNVAQGGCYE